MEMITEEHAKALAKTLCGKFNCQPCYMVIKKHLPYGSAAFYQKESMTIYIAQKGLNEFSVVHEFAHHLARIVEIQKKAIQRSKKNIEELKERVKTWDFGYAEMIAARRSAHVRRKSHKRREVHGDDFCRALKKVVLAHYGDLSLYDWDSEYKTVAKKCRP